MQTENQREYSEYVEEVREAVEREIGKTVRVQKVNKNNGLVLDGLTILAEGVNVSPTIYLNGFFEEYLSDGAVAVAKRILAIYEANKPKESVDFSFFMDREKVSPKIKMKLINYEKNKELLVQVPHIRFLDLAIVFMVVLGSDYDNGFASILIQNHHLSFWSMDAEDLYNLAMNNTADDFEIIPMRSVIEAIMDEESASIIMDNGEIEMSILTNHSRLQGAAGMLHKEIIKQYMKETKADKVWIIPSSIHETLLIPCDLMPDMEYVKGMVKEVNATQVQPEEILSDNVYVYDGNEITIAE
ncbi:MAG: DUF5688 family protein [Lachnospiraceae bacterium]|nr:DUF5688 family protein [Lachnospiraceae bacterium]